MRFAFVTDPSVSYNRRVVRGISQYARSCGDLQVRVLPLQDPKQFVAIDQAGYDGLLLGTYEAVSAEARNLKTPAVNVSNTHVGLRFPQVVADDFEVGRVVGEHLLAKSYRHFAFWGQTTGWGEERWRGFSSVIIQTLGKEYAPARSTAIDRRQVVKWLRPLPRPMGLMASNDPTAVDVIEICRQEKWRIPEDIAVVGVDDDELFVEVTDPPLSSVALQTQRIGYLAAESLRRLVNGEVIPQSTFVPPGPLVARQSSHAVAVSDPVVLQAIQFMHENLVNNVNIAEVADAVGVSRRSLEMRFMNALGQTPGKELSHLKIDRAKSLLATSTMPMKQIAVLSGFGKLLRLSQAFRNITGQTPTEYRRQFTHDTEGLKHGNR